MTATDPIKEAIEYWDSDKDFHYDTHTPEEELFAQAKKSYWLPYQWSLWVTSWARFRLHEGIELVTNGLQSDFVYCDTDSVKYIGEADWSKYNAARIEDSIETGSFADDSNGKRHYMGVYEEEETYTRFRSTGSKKYAVEINGKLMVTIAGVNKIKGAEELSAYGIEALKDGFVFYEGGGLAAKYNDAPAVTEYSIDGHKLHIISNCYLFRSPYTLGTLEIYRRIIEMSKIEVDKLVSLYYNKLAPAKGD